MTLREHEQIVIGSAPIVRIVAHHGVEKHGHDLCRGGTARRVTAAGFGCGTDRVDTEAGCLLL